MWSLHVNWVRSSRVKCCFLKCFLREACVSKSKWAVHPPSYSLSISKRGKKPLFIAYAKFSLTLPQRYCDQPYNLKHNITGYLHSKILSKLKRKGTNVIYIYIYSTFWLSMRIQTNVGGKLCFELFFYNEL